MNKKSGIFSIHRLFLIILPLSMLFMNPLGNAVSTVQAQNSAGNGLDSLSMGTVNDEFIIKPGNYQIPENLLTSLQAKLGEISENSGGATSFGVGYYEEHSNWAWIDLLVANGNYFNEERIGPSFLYFGVKNSNTWNVALAENDREYLSLLDSVSRDNLSQDEIELLNGYYSLNRIKFNVDALGGNLLFPWSNTQNSWQFSTNGFHEAGFQSLGVEPGAQAMDLIPPDSAQPAKVLAMGSGMIVKKLECTWNTVLIVRHDGYPDTKRFVYLHIQNGTSPVGDGAAIYQGEYLGNLHMPVFNGYWSNGICSNQGSGPFNCERDVNPATNNLCSSSDIRHLHLGFGTDKNIIIDGNVVGNLVPGNKYNSTNQESSNDVVINNDEFNNSILDPRWHWYREDPTHWSLSTSPGYLRIITQPKDIWQSSNNAPLLLQSLQSFFSNNFGIQTRIVIAPTANFHQGGLVIYGDDDNYVRLTYAYINGPVFEFAKEIGGDFQPIQVPAPPDVDDFHLRIVKSGMDYSAYYSRDGQNWIWIGTHLNVNVSPLEVGLSAFNAVSVTLTEIPADFDYFLVTTQEKYSFADVPSTYWAWQYIERLYSAGITGGCTTSPLNYCPDNTVTRAQMAVFLLKGVHGSSYSPPAVGSGTGFADVPTSYWAAPWIKQLAAEGITGGCGGGNFCPDTPVTRAQMAVFLLKSKHGVSYVPPAATGVFADVPVGYWADKWIEQLAAEGITGGCGGGNYCPDTPVTRAQMAVFLVKTFNLP